MKKSTPYLIIALKRLLAGETLSDLPPSKNSNQYFVTIKKHGIELVEAWKPNLTRPGRHKERSLHQTLKNINRAKKYLESLQGVAHKKPLKVQKNTPYNK